MQDTFHIWTRNKVEISLKDNGKWEAYCNALHLRVEAKDKEGAAKKMKEYINDSFDAMDDEEIER